MKQKSYYALLGFIVTISLVGSFISFSRNNKDSNKNHNTLITFESKEKLIKLTYPSTFKFIDITEDKDAPAGLFFKAIQEDPSALISIRQEVGLGILKLTGGTILDSLTDSVNKQYPKRFPGYKKELFQENIVANEKVVTFEFTYLGADQETTMKQRLVILVKNNDAYYLSFQSKQEDFEKLGTIFDQITGSIEFLNG